MIVADVALVVAGVAIVVVVLDSAIRTFVLPRGAPVPLTRLVFRVSRKVFDLITAIRRTYERRDAVMAMYAPITLMILPAVWIALVFLGFALVHEAVDSSGWNDAFTTSGSSLLTLGFERPPSGASTWISFVEAAIGLAIIALLIAYLPQIYSAFSRREVAVSKLSVRAGTPPDSGSLLIRSYRAGYLDHLDDVWREWETWFAELAETHTSLAVLSFFRSPSPKRSWITAAGVVLDAASLRYAVLAIPWTPFAGLCIRSGYLALDEIAGYFGIEYDPDPAPTDPISISRDEFNEMYERLSEAGLPVQLDRDAAWRDYAGWRVNYDKTLLALCALMAAPYAMWSSDRSLRTGRRSLRPKRYV